MTHICINKLTIIGSDNGLSPGRRQAIIWTNAGILLIGPLGTNFSEILIKICTFSFKKMHLKMSSGKRRPFCLGLNVIFGVWVDRLTTTSSYSYVIRHQQINNSGIFFFFFFYFCNWALIFQCWFFFYQFTIKDPQGMKLIPYKWNMAVQNT